jgi:hypothetical protein
VEAAVAVGVARGSRRGTSVSRWKGNWRGSHQSGDCCDDGSHHGGKDDDAGRGGPSRHAGSRRWLRREDRHAGQVKTPLLNSPRRKRTPRPSQRPRGLSSLRTT